MDFSQISRNEPVYKQFDTDIEPLADRLVKFTITTSAPDRERDVVDAHGLDITNYLKNPVVLFGHSYRDLPVGRAVHLERKADRIIATTEFATADLNPMAEQVFRMVKGGFLKAASIGFRPTKWVYNESRRGVDFHEAELLEYSIVPVPANAQALVAAGISTSVVRSWAQRTLAALDSTDTPSRFSAQLARAYEDRLIRDEARLAHEADDVVLTLADDDPSDPVLTIRSSELSREIQRATERAIAPLRARQASATEAIDIDEDELRALVHGTLKAEVGAMLARETQAALNRLRGRID